MSALYKETIESKNGLTVPIYASGRAAHSKYDPEREAQAFGQETSESSFAVIIGAAGGYHIKSLLDKNPSCALVIIEKTQEDLDFLLKNVPCIAELSKKTSITFCAAENDGQIGRTLAQKYFPAHYGAISILSLRSWVQEAPEDFEKILSRAKGALNQISADYSTQAHFGRLWTKNIFCNLKTLKKIQKGGQGGVELCEADLKKTAAIIAAGPSLDQSVNEIVKNRDKYFVIATDTALKAFGRRKIKVDAAVSIDAQYLSAEHFNAASCEDAIIVLDLAANPSIANYALSKKAKIVFTGSGHPLISFASCFCKSPFINLSSGGGTVAICAADFAKKCGFEKIKIFGADFGYSQGKPYTKGTYLDDLYQAGQNKSRNAETAFVRLMFRTELNKNARGFSQSPTLLRYQETMEAFLDKWEWKDKIYHWANPAAAQNAAFKANEFDFSAFKAALKSLAEKLEKTDDFIPEESLILPEMAYWRAQADKKGSKKISIKEIKKLALKSILLYNKLI
ncbi:MAG: motility associated factor glycosyltransferase family protein [Treponema sp.]|nr:motility associated factor glycosyltransferase family protein [Treponema sp.]